MLLKSAAFLLSLAALGSAVPAETTESKDSSEAKDSTNSHDSHWPWYPGKPSSPFPPREIQPDAVIAHSIPTGAWPNACTDPIVNPYNYIYQSITGFNQRPYGQTLLYTFTFPEESRGKECWLDFYHDQPIWQTSPVVRVNVFTTRVPATCTRSSTENYRDLLLGTWDVPKTGKATWQRRASDYFTYRTPCPRPGAVRGFELAVVGGDEVGLSYPSGPNKGFRILYA